MLQKVETEFTGMYSKINSQLKAIEEKINKDISKANTAPPPVDPVTTPLNSVESIASSLANEQKEREKRKLNVIVHNVAESDASSGLARKQEDISKLQTLFKDYMQITPNISNAIRLGKKNSGARLLKVTVCSIDEKSAILRNKSKLKIDNNPTHVKNTYVTLDLTPLEQKKRKLL